MKLCLLPAACAALHCPRTPPAAKFKLATLVQYVPLPVVGGYLGYVGYFCLAAGIGLGCSTTINTFSSWANLFGHGRHSGSETQGTCSSCLLHMHAVSAAVQ